MYKLCRDRWTVDHWDMLTDSLSRAFITVISFFHAWFMGGKDRGIFFMCDDFRM